MKVTLASLHGARLASDDGDLCHIRPLQEEEVSSP